MLWIPKWLSEHGTPCYSHILAKHLMALSAMFGTLMAIPLLYYALMFAIIAALGILPFSNYLALYSCAFAWFYKIFLMSPTSLVSILFGVVFGSPKKLFAVIL